MGRQERLVKHSGNGAYSWLLILGTCDRNQGKNPRTAFPEWPTASQSAETCRRAAWLSLAQSADAYDLVLNKQLLFKSLGLGMAFSVSTDD